MPLTTQRIDSSTSFAITNTNKSLEQVKSGNKCAVGIPVGMQGIIKTQEESVQSNSPFYSCALSDLAFE